LAVLGAMAGVLLGTATAAHAHTALESSSPPGGSTVTAPLPTVDLTFTGQVLLREVTVTDPGGADASTGPATASGAVVSRPVTLTAAGSYTVTYAVTSSDGHVVEGTFDFTYAPPAAPAAPASTSEAGPTGTAAPSTTVRPDQAAAETRSPRSAGWVLPAVAVVVVAAAVGLVLRWRRARR
jgi:methionine-rich copper-binding protein CopC